MYSSKLEQEALCDRFCELVVSHKKYSTVGKLKRHLEYFFGNNPLTNAKVLDIGGGQGLLTLYSAVNGADGVCLEPEFSGSTSGMIESFHRLKEELDFIPGTAEMEVSTFQEYESQEQFDYIILANSINHLDEETTIRLQEDQVAYETYLGYFRKMYELLKSGGHVIITDCDRVNFFNYIGMKSPFMPSIEWEKHQSPFFWCAMAEQVGFEKVSVRWTSPNSLGFFGRAFMGNRFASYFLLSHFRLEVRKVG